MPTDIRCDGAMSEFRGGPTMFARIGMMKALNRHVQRVFDPSRKEKHWGQRKLARVAEAGMVGISFYLRTGGLVLLQVGTAFVTPTDGQ